MTSTTRKDLVNAIAAQLQLKQSVVNDVVFRTFEAITDALLSERRIELRGFGVFKIRTRARRQARNPRTNALIVVPERYTVSFKPGVELKKKIASSSLGKDSTNRPVQPAANTMRRTVRNNHRRLPAAPPESPPAL